MLYFQVLFYIGSLLNVILYWISSIELSLFTVDPRYLSDWTCSRHIELISRSSVPTQKKVTTFMSGYLGYHYAQMFPLVILLWETSEQITQTTARCGVLATVGIRIHVFWNIIPCQLVTSYPVFRWLYAPLTLHSVTHLKIWIFIRWLPDITTYISDSQM